MRPELDRVLSACERLDQDRPEDVLELFEDTPRPLPVLEQSLVLAASGLLAERQGDREQAVRSFERVLELGVPVRELLRTSARFFRRQGRSTEANEAFSLLGDIEPAAIRDLAAGLSPAERVRYAPRVVPQFMRINPPELYALAPIKRAMTEALGGSAAAMSFAQMTGLQPDWDVEELPIVSLREFAKSRGVRYEEIAAPREVCVPPAPVFGTADSEGEVVTSRALFWCVVADATISSKSNFVIADDEALLDHQHDELEAVPIDLDVDPMLFDRDGARATFLLPWAGGEPLPAALSLVGVNSHAFGHLLVEFLPKLFALLGRSEFESVPIVVDQQMPPQHREAIEFFAGPEHPIVVLPPTHGLHVKELWTCSMVTNISLPPFAGSGNAVPLLALDGDAFGTLVARVEGKLEQIAPAAGKRIYLARKDTQLRKLVNREEVEAWFRARDFEIVDLEERSFVEQLALVRGADVIVGPDGSSMQMSFFAGPGTKIGILNNPHLEDHRFYRVACEALRQRLLILTGEVVTEHPGYRKFSDYRIEPAALPPFLDALTEDSKERPWPVRATGVSSGSSIAPKVSVLLQTYNHERYIERAVESVLAQDAPFPIELIVSDDLSEDGTRERIAPYAEAHPDLVKPLFPEEHLGMNQLFMRALSTARGEYLALLDGDDYWTAPDKLQRQVSVLDSSPELTGCFHDAVIVYEDGRRPPHRYVPGARKERYGIEDLIRLCYPPTLSVLFRRDLLARTPDWAFGLAWADWALWILATRHGPFGFLDEVMGAYRVHEGGYFSSRDRSSQLEEDIAMYRRLLKHLPEHRSLIEHCLSYRASELAVEECRLPYNASIVVIGERGEPPLQFNGRTVRYLEPSAETAEGCDDVSGRVRRLCDENGQRRQTPVTRPRAAPRGSDDGRSCYVVVPTVPGEQPVNQRELAAVRGAARRAVWKDDRCTIYELGSIGEQEENAASRQPSVPSPRAVILKVSRRDPPDPAVRGRIEKPAVGDVIDLSDTYVVGWALGHDAPVTRVEVECEGHVVWARRPAVMRADVAKRFPNHEWADAAGFRGSVDLAAAIGAAKTFELAVIAVLPNGRRVAVGSVRGSTDVDPD